MTDDMQRYQEIKATADPDDPFEKLRRSVVVACDQALVEAIRLERQGKPGKVRALGFAETADECARNDATLLRKLARELDDIETAPIRPTAQAWLRYRADELDPDCRVDPAEEFDPDRRLPADDTAPR